jgi:RHS repeat-associated protein
VFFDNLQVTHVRGPLVSESAYSPWGLELKGISGNALNFGNPGSQKYKYNGKELQSQEWSDGSGLEEYDYGARHYNAQIGRWMNIDPLAERYSGFSPYQYVVNNPINAIDIDGREIIFLIRNQDGSVREQLKYSGGNFWHENGSRYDPGKESLSGTLYRVLASYRKIENSKNRKLKSILKYLENSNLKHYVEEGKTNEVWKNFKQVADKKDPNKSEEVLTSTQTTYNFDKNDPSDAGIGKSDVSTVAHEMRHQYDHDIKNMGDNEEGNDASDPAEIRAVYLENLARELEGLERRTKYGGNTIDPILLKSPPNNIFPKGDEKGHIGRKVPPPIEKIKKNEKLL